MPGSGGERTLTEARWFVAHVKPRQEEAVCARCADQGVEAFLPKLLAWRRHGSRRWQAAEPLFPGYVFLRFSPDPGVLYRVRWTRGVKRLLGGDEGPTPVEDEVVAYLRARTGPDGFIVPNSRLVQGARVRFVGGPFALLEGIIDRPASRAERVQVLLRLCGTVVRVEAHVDELVPV
jgi:transcriptional antiterminator RfaH